MTYTKRKLNIKAVIANGLAVFAMILASFPLSVNTASAWTGPSWLPINFRLAVADESDAKAFVLPGEDKTSPTIKTYKMDMTAYTSSVEECDDSPFTTADGSHVRDGIVATNILPFGTHVRIPTLFGDKIFEVHDRMNARYSARMDVWMQEKTDMRQFGLHRNVPIEVIKMGDGKKQWNKVANAS